MESLYKKVIGICKDMFNIREYTLVNEEPFSLIGRKPNGKLIHLHILQTDKLNVNIIKYYYALFHTDGINHGIIVYQNVVTSSVKKILSNINDIHIELFQLRELTFNITKHRLVPKHISVLPIEGEDISKYPVIKKTDPVVRFHGFKPGNLIKIIRNNGSIYYRIVK